MGRPSSYTPEIAAEICELLASGMSLLDICASNDKFPPESTIRRWYVVDYEGFAAEYARARDIGLDHEADEIRKIADTPMEGTKTVNDGETVTVTTGDMIEHRRLQIDARKWRLSKMAPKRYGDKLDLTHAAPGGGPVQSELTIRLVKAKDSGEPEQ